MTNHELAKRYIKKQQLIGCDVLELDLVENDGVLLRKVKDNGSKSIIIPSFITSYKGTDGKYTKPFEDTYYEDIIIESNVGDIGYLFSGIRGKRLTIKVNSDIEIKIVNGLFSHAEYIEELNIEFKGSVDISSIKSVEFMYMYCRELKVVYVSWLSGAMIENSADMFYGCGKLEGIRGLSSLCMSNIKDMSNMFSYCFSLGCISIDLSNTVSTNGMFKRCNSLKSVIISSKESKELKVKDMKEMFCGCEVLDNVEFRGVSIEDVENLKGMFRWCERLKNIDLSCIKSRKIEDMRNMFEYCNDLEYIDLSGIDRVYDNIDILKIFNGCDKLLRIVLGDGIRGSKLYKAANYRLKE